LSSQSCFIKTLSGKRLSPPIAGNNQGNFEISSRVRPASGRFVQPKEKIMKKFLTALALLGVIVTPAMSQSFSANPYGTGNSLPFSYGPVPSQNGEIAGRVGGLQSYASAPRTGSFVNPNDPALTGGGSVGYNEDLKND
jgi:hypothetical protein